MSWVTFIAMSQKGGKIWKNVKITSVEGKLGFEKTPANLKNYGTPKGTQAKNIFENYFPHIQCLFRSLKLITRAHEIITRAHEIITHAHKIITCAHEIN